MISTQTDCVKGVGKDAVADRPHLYGHDLHLLSGGVLRLVGLAVRSSENCCYLDADHTRSNHTCQVQGKSRSLSLHRLK